MMKFALLFGTALLLVASQISPKYMVADNCKGCHKWVVDGWKSSWHSRSHYSKDPLYKATLQFMSKKLHKPLEVLEVKCAQCHNPRIMIKRVDEDEIFAAGFGMKSQKVYKALNEPYIKDGINCIICHNIDHIKESKNPEDRGYKSIVWGPNDTMVGPFADAKSPYHKTKQGEHFLHPNKLCFVCHYNGRNSYGIEVYETGKEYEGAKGEKKSCVECHMSEKRERRIANVVVEGYVPKLRQVRDHLFMGARNGNILLKALDVDVQKRGGKLVVELVNRTPHRVPTGFGGREVVFEALFDNGKRFKKRFLARFVDEKGRETVPYLGVKKVEESRFEPYQKRTFTISIPKGAKEVEIRIMYKLVNDELRTLLNVKDPLFEKAYEIADFSMRL